uniref:Death domain-containing protein n=2 Tax=Amphimedon queenslandica TaxID=400682 RepID=A0A1X7TXA3_AMPQE
MDRAMDTSTSSAIPPAILSRRTLNIKDLDELIALLERHHYNKASYHQLGLRLKLSYNTLEKIKKNHGEVDPCFTECLAGWLRKPDGVETPTIDTLIAALRGIEENAVADGIEGERQRILAPAPMAAVPLSRSDEPMVATPPTSHTSEGHLIQPVATVNPGVVDLELKIDRYPELQEIANNLQGKYDFLVSALEKSLKDHHIDVKRAKRLIERCLMTKAGVVSELKPCIDIFEKANDFESFFDFLSKYKFIGYINYKLLKKLAELVKDDEINNRFYEYEKEYTKLLSSASFQDIIPLLERKSELSPTAPLGLPYVSFRLERPWLHTVVYTWISTFGEFSWSYYALLKQLRENCVIITYAILPCVLDDVIRDLNDPVILKKLEDKDVTVTEIIESPQKEEGIKEKERFIKKLMENLQATEKELKEVKETHEDYMSKDKLKQHERDLEDTSSELKIKDELCQKAKEELEEEQRICGEKIEEANTNYAQRKKETQRDMEEQLQILRQESSQALALKGMVSALVNELVEMGLINVTNVVTDVKDNMTDMKSGMKQTAQKIKETQRQMSDKMNETTEELSKKMEEQGTAFRDEVQSTTSRLKDELAAKTDEQVEGMTEKIKTDVKEAIIANIVASSAPVQETTYTAFEEDQNPHDQETSHHILSSSSSNCGNDTYSMQETHDTTQLIVTL